MKKYIVCFIILLVIVPVYRANASVVINEVMYDLQDVSDTDHEWVELYNNGDSVVSISGWKYNDGSNHNLNAPPINGGQGTLSIINDGYIILTGNASVFLSDHPGFTGTVIDTVMSLKNTSSTISILNSTGETIDTLNYSSDMGGNGDGHSLGRVNNNFISTEPTPGFENTAPSAPPPDPNDTDTNNPPVNNPPPQPPAVHPPVSNGGLPLEKLNNTPVNLPAKIIPITIKILASIKTFTGVPLTFSSQPIGTYHEPLYKGRFVWSFGDGSSKTSVDTKEFTHTYQNSGEYVVYLEYYQYDYETKPDAVDRITIKATSPVVSVTNITEDNSVEIVNNGNQEIDLMNWKISSGNGEYSFTNHLFILPKNRIRISKEVLQFDTKGTEPALINPSGNKLTSSLAKSSKMINGSNYKVLSKKTLNEIVPINVSSNQSATAIESMKSSNPYLSRTALIVIGFGLLMLVVFGSVMFLWNKKTNSRNDDVLEFDIDRIE